jgi:hypothetical protein
MVYVFIACHSEEAGTGKLAWQGKIGRRRIFGFCKYGVLIKLPQTGEVRIKILPEQFEFRSTRKNSGLPGEPA